MLTIVFVLRLPRLLHGPFYPPRSDKASLSLWPTRTDTHAHTLLSSNIQAVIPQPYIRSCRSILLKRRPRGQRSGIPKANRVKRNLIAYKKTSSEECVCVCVRQCEWHGSKRVSCIQKFPCLMCLGDDMEVSTHPYSLCTNSDSEINNIFKFLPVFIKGWKFPTAPSLFPISAAPCNCILTFTLATDRWALYPKIYTSNSLVAHQTTALKLCIVNLFNPGLKTAFILTFPSSRNVWEYFKLLLSGPETAVGREAGTEKFAQRVRLPVGPSPFYPSQWRDWPVLHKDIPGQAISPYKAKECTGYSLLLPQTLLGMFGGKGRNDRNYDKAALFREKGLNI